MWPMGKYDPAKFESPERREIVRQAALTNATLGGAYLMIVARGFGLDVGPMGGFDRAAVDAEFFPDGRLRVDLAVQSRVRGRHEGPGAEAAARVQRGRAVRVIRATAGSRGPGGRKSRPGACSSAVERPAHNWLRAGSNPAGPIPLRRHSLSVRTRPFQG